MGRSLREGLDAWHAKADGKCAVDYALPHDPLRRERVLAQGDGPPGRRRASPRFKLFMAYPGVFYSDDGQILRAMQRAAGNGGLIMMHAENGIAIDVLVEQALAAGRTDPRYHGEVRKALLEAEATHRAIQLARVAGAPLYVVHVSADEAVAELAAARDKGLPVFGETCPQYLFLSTDNLAEPDFEGAKYVCSTPLRPARAPGGAVARAAHQRPPGRLHRPLPVLLHGPEGDGPRRLLQDPQRHAGRGDTGMDLLHQAVVDGHISRRRWIEIACATPARMFGLYPRKGTIAPGADADVVIYDPARRADALRRDAPHERRLLGVRGQAGHRPRRDGAVARGPGDRGPGVRGARGPRHVRAAGDMPVPVTPVRPVAPARAPFAGRPDASGAAGRGPHPSGVLLLHERQEVRVDDVRMRREHPVGVALVALQPAVLAGAPPTGARRPRTGRSGRRCRVRPGPAPSIFLRSSVKSVSEKALMHS